MRHIVRKLLGACALAALALAVVSLAGNHHGTSYEELDNTQRAVIDQYGALCGAVGPQGEGLWADDPLTGRPVLAVGSLAQGALLINPDNEPNPLTSTRISLPEESPLKVYRVASADPALLATIIAPGNFGLASAAGIDAFYVRLTSGSFATEDYTGRFIYTLAHESLHEYMQSDWPMGSQLADGMSDSDMEMVYDQIDALDAMQAEMDSVEPDPSALDEALRAFVDADDRLGRESPTYEGLAATKYTDEGTAQYVGIKAERLVGARPIHVVENGHGESVPFARIGELLRDGSLDKEWVMGRNYPYFVGAMLCQVFDELQVPSWQERLNAQTLDNPLTVVDIAREAVYGDKT